MKSSVNPHAIELDSHPQPYVNKSPPALKRGVLWMKFGIMYRVELQVEWSLGCVQGELFYMLSSEIVVTIGERNWGKIRFTV